MTEYLNFCVRMYIITYFYTLIPVLYYWCLAYIHNGTIALRMYVTVVSPYPWDRGATCWYQSLGSHTFSTASLQINVGLIYNWVTRIFAIHCNHTYEVIYSFLEIHPLTSKISYSVTFSVSSNMERRRTHNGSGTSCEGPYGENDMMRIL